MTRKKYAIYVQLYYNKFNNYGTVITTITKLKIAINTLHSPEINIQ